MHLKADTHECRRGDVAAAVQRAVLKLADRAAGGPDFVNGRVAVAGNRQLGVGMRHERFGLDCPIATANVPVGEQETSQKLIGRNWRHAIRANHE